MRIVLSRQDPEKGLIPAFAKIAAQAAPWRLHKLIRIRAEEKNSLAP
jgi:hypothetical protein